MGVIQAKLNHLPICTSSFQAEWDLVLKSKVVSLTGQTKKNLYTLTLLTAYHGLDLKINNYFFLIKTKLSHIIMCISFPISTEQMLATLCMRLLLLNVMLLLLLPLFHLLLSEVVVLSIKVNKLKKNWEKNLQFFHLLMLNIFYHVRRQSCQGIKMNLPSNFC